MKTDNNAVALAKQIARQKLEGRNGTGPGIVNVEIELEIVKDVQTALSMQGHNLSEDELSAIVLDEMVGTGRFQIGGTPIQVYIYRVMQIGLALLIAALWIIALTLGNAPSNLRFLTYFVVAVVSIALTYCIFLTNKLIKNSNRLNVLGE